MLKNKQFIINLVSQMVGFLVNAMISFFITPMIISGVSADAYGFYGLSNNFIGYMQIITISINSMVSRFITMRIHEGKMEEANKYYSTAIFTNVIVAIGLSPLFVLIFLKFGVVFDINEELLRDVRIMWVFIFFTFILGLFNSILSTLTFAKNRLDLQAFGNIIFSFIKCVFLFVMYICFDKKIWYLGFSVFLYSVLTLIWTIYNNRRLYPDTRVKLPYFNKNYLIELFKAGVWNSLAQTGFILTNGFDLIIANKFIGASAMGYLALAKTIPTIVMGLFKTFGSLFQPKLVQLYSQKKQYELEDIFLKSIKFLGVLSSVIVSNLFVFSRKFYELWVPNEDFKLIYLVSIIIFLEMIFSLIMETSWFVFTLVNKVRELSSFMIISSFINLLVLFVFLENMEKNYMIFAIVGISTLFSIFRNLYYIPKCVSKYINININKIYSLILKTFLTTIALAIINYLIVSNIQSTTWIAFITIVSIITILNGYCSINVFFGYKSIDNFLRVVKK